MIVWIHLKMQVDEVVIDTVCLFHWYIGYIGYNAFAQVSTASPWPFLAASIA